MDKCIINVDGATAACDLCDLRCKSGNRALDRETPLLIPRNAVKKERNEITSEPFLLKNARLRPHNDYNIICSLNECTDFAQDTSNL